MHFILLFSKAYIYDPDNCDLCITNTWMYMQIT